MTAPVLSLGGGLGVLWGPVRQMVEDAALQLLWGYHRMAGGYLETLEPYGGELDSEEGLDRLVKQSLGGAPLVLVGAQDSTFARQGGISKRAYREEVLLELVVASSSLRGYPARTRGGPEAGPQDDSFARPTSDPGVFRILEDLRRALLGAKLWIDGADAAELVREAPVFTVDRLTLWRAHYKVGVAFAAEYGTTAPPATSIRTRHHLDQAVGVNPLVVTDAP